MIPKLPSSLEKAIARAFIKAAPKSGRVPAQKPYRRSRDEKFIRNWCVSTKTSIRRPGLAGSNLESVIEAIFVGLRAGYSEADIAAYIKRNYVVD